MKRKPNPSIFFATFLAAATACSRSDETDGPSSTAETGSSIASCADECRDFYDCRFSLCLLQGGSSCGTQRIEGHETCDHLSESDCTGSLLSTYDACEPADTSEGSGESSSSTSDGDSSSSGWAESSGDGASSSGSTGASCLPSNSFCDFDFECCSGVCDFDFDFCH